MAKKSPRKQPEIIVFRTEFIHYRTGKLMKAKDYGHTAWPFGKRR